MAKAYRGVLKARINKLYGGDVTCGKVKKLKSRKDATKRDVQLANWFINMHNCCLLYTSPSPRDVEESRMPSSA